MTQSDRSPSPSKAASRLLPAKTLALALLERHRRQSTVRYADRRQARTAGSEVADSAVAGSAGAVPNTAGSGAAACAADIAELEQRLAEETRLRVQFESELRSLKTRLSIARMQLLDSQSREQSARALASVDYLTRLNNRSSFHDRLREALRTGGRRPWELAVMYIDLDAFKSVNDNHGHDVGDELLKIVAARLSKCLRAEDTIGRYGGDEFVCALRHLGTLERATEIACKVLDTLSAPCQIGHLRLCIRPSIGIACFPHQGTTAAGLLKCADAAMYRAKRYRMGYAFYTGALDTEARGMAADAAPDRAASSASDPRVGIHTYPLQ